MSVFAAGHSAVITGGASGIGLALAAKCVAHGMRVLVADCDAAALAAAAQAPAATSGPGTLSTFQMDVSRLDDWARLQAHLGPGSSPVHLLALNAGIGGASPWTDAAAFRRILDTNLFGVINGLATLLPSVQAAAKTPAPAAVVITGSKQGITNPPGTSPAYNASKAALKSLAEGLAFDQDTNKTGVHVHLLVPGWAYTGLGGNKPTLSEAERQANKPAGAWWPAQVADYLEAAVQANKFYIVCPDNDVTEAVDKKRMEWAAADVAEGRPALSRWRPEYADEFAAWMKD